MQHGQREVSVKCHMRKDFATSTSSHWNADAPELTSSLPSRFSKIKLTSARLTSSSAHPEPGYEGTPTDYCKDAGAVYFLLKYWNKLPARLVLAPSVSIFKKTIGSSMVRNLSCSTCVISVPLHGYFSLSCNPRLFMFPPNTVQFM